MVTDAFNRPEHCIGLRVHLLVLAEAGVVVDTHEAIDGVLGDKQVLGSVHNSTWNFCIDSNIVEVLQHLEELKSGEEGERPLPCLICERCERMQKKGRRGGEGDGVKE